MNNFDKLKSLNIDQLVEFLDTNGHHDAVWCRWFEENYCNKCESVKATIPGYGFGKECAFAWCELAHRCIYFPDMDEVPGSKEVIKMWLDAEVK